MFSAIGFSSVATGSGGLHRVADGEARGGGGQQWGAGATARWEQ